MPENTTQTTSEFPSEGDRVVLLQHVSDYYSRALKGTEGTVLVGGCNCTVEFDTSVILTTGYTALRVL